MVSTVTVLEKEGETYNLKNILEDKAIFCKTNDKIM
jgi:hypothetical protein